MQPLLMNPPHINTKNEEYELTEPPLGNNESYKRNILFEINKTIHKLRTEWATISARRLETSREIIVIDKKLSRIFEKAQLAAAHGRSDLAEAIAVKSSVMEKRLSDLEHIELETFEQEKQLELCINAFVRIKAELEIELNAVVLFARGAERTALSSMRAAAEIRIATSAHNTHRASVREDTRLNHCL